MTSRPGSRLRPDVRRSQASGRTAIAWGSCRAAAAPRAAGLRMRIAPASFLPRAAVSASSEAGGDEVARHRFRVREASLQLVLPTEGPCDSMQRRGGCGRVAVCREHVGRDRIGPTKSPQQHVGAQGRQHREQRLHRRRVLPEASAPAGRQCRRVRVDRVEVGSAPAEEEEVELSRSRTLVFRPSSKARPARLRMPAASSGRIFRDRARRK